METIYHGSKLIIQHPAYGKGNPENDYGLGFYCTRELDLAKEWACAEEDDGFANRYRLETDGLSCLHLNNGGYHILNWLAILLENRRFDLSSPVSVRARQYILDTFLPDYKDYDLIEGYRADDAYFSFSRAFLANGITLEQLRRAMRLGKLGEQVVLRTPAAFDALSFVEAIPVDASIYHARRLSRDRDAREDFRKMLTETQAGEEIYVSTIINEKWNNDDPRL
jgi:hypothetical protein